MNMALWTYPFTICQCQLFGPVTSHYKTAVMTGLGRVFRADRDKLMVIKAKRYKKEIVVMENVV